MLLFDNCFVQMCLLIGTFSQVSNCPMGLLFRSLKLFDIGVCLKLSGVQSLPDSLNWNSPQIKHCSMKLDLSICILKEFLWFDRLIVFNILYTLVIHN